MVKLKPSAVANNGLSGARSDARPLTPLVARGVRPQGRDPSDLTAPDSQLGRQRSGGPFNRVWRETEKVADWRRCQVVSQYPKTIV
jgi:hypothetical protein